MPGTFRAPELCGTRVAAVRILQICTLPLTAACAGEPAFCGPCEISARARGRVGDAALQPRILDGCVCIVTLWPCGRVRLTGGAVSLLYSPMAAYACRGSRILPSSILLASHPVAFGMWMHIGPEQDRP